ncbi:MAG: hypothetical protein QG671_3597 [Actinomycetota bacterium]|nr:hypothetical protein [Actinomycetota bacterium]
MHKCINRLSVLSVGLLLAVGSGAGSVANAATSSFSGTGNASLFGGQSAAVRQCVISVRDGDISQHVNSCNQVSVAGNSITLTGVNISVYRPGSSVPVYTGSSSTVTLTGTLAASIAACVVDARDLSIQPATASLCGVALRAVSNDLYLAATGVTVA